MDSKDSDQTGIITVYCVKPRSHIACDCDAIALQPKTLTIAERSQRSRKGFIEVAKRSPIGRRTKLVTSCLLSIHKRLTATNLVTQRFHWSPRGLMLVADLSPTVWRSVSPQKGRVSLQCGSNLSVTDRRWGGDRSALYRRLVSDQLQSGFQACANHSAMGLQTSSTCLRMTASSRNKCSMRSDRLLKMVCKRSWKRDLLAIQGLNQYSLLLVNRLYTIMATIAAFCFTLCRRSNCNCPVVNILKTCKEMVRLWNASFLYVFVLIENRSTVSHRPVTAQLQPVTDHSPIFVDRSQQIASLSPYVWLTVANRSPINRWQVAKPVAD